MHVLICLSGQSVMDNECDAGPTVTFPAAVCRVLYGVRATFWAIPMSCSI